ncbi:MAG: hydroxymethylbilane synthase [Bacteroidia bacterium]|nr:hydroxymethylbilane synthase [Bacteroidia bacterium]
MKNPIVIGTRGSELALWQANHIKDSLAQMGINAELKIIKTQGDKIQDLSFDKLEGKGFFTKELEDALLNKEVDLAVHSCKDLPTSMPEGLAIAVLSEREDPSELLLIRPEAKDGMQTLKLKNKAIVGTSSSRRKSQLWAMRPDLEIKDLRGNVPTRIKKLREGHYDAIMLAYAGTHRIQMDLSGLEVVKLSPKEFIPAPAQGVLALQTRENDLELIEALQPLNNSLTQETSGAEREVLRLFQGGCQIPLGVYSEKSKEKIQLWASSSETADQIPKRVFLTGTNPKELAALAVDKLKEKSGKSVFITRTLKPDDYLVTAMNTYQYQLVGHSLIEIKPLKFTNLLPADWLFFTSKNGVRHFFGQLTNLGFSPKIGVAGRGTEKVLNEFGYQADFVGEGSDMNAVGKEFAALADGKSILFPQAADSLQTIQKHLSFSSRAINLLVYQTTRKKDVQIPDSDIVVITSPSNADVYFGREKFPEYKHLIAIGESTAHRIESYKIKGFSVANRPDDLGITEMVFAV